MTKMTKKESKQIIKEIEWGYAYNIDNVIYINKHLKEYPELYAKVVNHEKSHEPGFTLRNIMIDIRDSLKSDGFMFVLKYPKSMVQVLPISIIDGIYAIDYFLCMVYGIALILLILLYLVYTGVV